MRKLVKGIFFASLVIIYSQSFIYAQEVNTSDTVFIWNGSDVNNLKFVMRNTGINVHDLYSIENNELKFATNEVGYFRTKETYSNFKLHAEWKWPDKIENGNSGILIYTQQDTVWPKCVQVQLKSDNAGDIIAMNTIVAEAAGKPKDTAVKLGSSSENKPGEWNQCDVLCVADYMEVYINGKLMNKVSGIEITNGTIGFQLEGKPVEFKNIYLTKGNFNKN